MQVLERIALGDPASVYAEMSPTDRELIARSWRAELSDVPAEAVPELYRRTMDARTHTFPLKVDDFRLAWRAWDYFAEINRTEPSPSYAALPEAPPEKGHGFHVYRVQAKIKEKFGVFVCCYCVGKYENREAATQRPNKKEWVCNNGLCNFVAKVGEEKEHFEAEFQNPPQLVRFTPVLVQKNEQGTVTTRKIEGGTGRREAGRVFRDWLDCGYCEFVPDSSRIEYVSDDLFNSALAIFESEGPAAVANFGAWANWFRVTYPGEKLSFERVDETWPIWSAEHNAKIAAQEAARGQNH